MIKLIWFLLWTGAAATDVSASIKKRRENMVSSSPNICQTRFDRGEVHQKRTETVQVGQDARNLKPVFSAAAHNTNCPPAHSPLNPINNHTAAISDRRYMHNGNPIQFDIPNNTCQHQNSSSDQVHSQSKKGYVVEAYFRDRKFSGEPEQSINNVIRDFEICAVQQCLDPPQMSLFFINILKDPARQFFLTHCSSNMNYSEIVSIMRRHYNSETRNCSFSPKSKGLNSSLSCTSMRQVMNPKV